MKPRLLGLIAVLLAGLHPVSAAACTPGRTPPFKRLAGISYFVATTVQGSPTAREIRAQVIIGRDDSAAMPAGAAILVPWSYAADCTPIPWDAARDGGPWSPPPQAAFYTGLLRPREQWINGVRTIDIHMAVAQPAWHGDGQRARQEYSSATGPLLTPLEFFDFYAMLPTSAEVLGKQSHALQRIAVWESAHRATATREPARSILEGVRRMFADTARTPLLRRQTQRQKH